MKNWNNVPYEKLIDNDIIQIIRRENETEILTDKCNSIILYLDESFIINDSVKFKGITAQEDLDCIVGLSIIKIEELDNRLLIYFDNGKYICLPFDDLPYESYLFFVNGFLFPV
jgi:hypothetical protein